MLLFTLIFMMTVSTAWASGPRYRNLIRCQLNEGYEIAVQRSGSSYYLTLIYGDRVEYRERLLKPLQMKLETDRNHAFFELKRSGSEDYLVKISADFDEDAASSNEFVHYKIRPKPSKVASYKMYEMAGDGLPLRNLGCFQP